MNRFDLEALAHPLYHGYADGTRTLTFGFLENCGYNMLSSDDVVGSLNEIIALHGRIRDSGRLVQCFGQHIWPTDRPDPTQIIQTLSPA